MDIELKTAVLVVLIVYYRIILKLVLQNYRYSIMPDTCERYSREILAKETTP